MNLSEKQISELKNISNKSADTRRISETVKKVQEIKTPEEYWPATEHAAVNQAKKNNAENSSNKQPSENNTINQKTSEMNTNIPCEKTKIISKTIELATAMAAGTRTTISTLGTEYKRVLGYYMLQTSLGGLTAGEVKVGIGDGTRTVMENTNIDHYTASTSVPPNERFIKDIIDLPAGKLEFALETDATTSSALEIQVIMKVEKH